MTAIRVVIVDDHPLFRQGLRQVIQGDTRFELVGEAGDGKSAEQLVLRLDPDLVVLDVNLPDAPDWTWLKVCVPRGAALVTWCSRCSRTRRPSTRP